MNLTYFRNMASNALRSKESWVRSNESIGWWEVLERQDVRRHIAATQIVIIPSAKLLSMETLLRVMEDEEEWPYTTYICLNLGLCVYIIIRVNFYESFGSTTRLFYGPCLDYSNLSYGYTMRVPMQKFQGRPLRERERNFSRVDKSSYDTHVILVGKNSSKQI